MKQLIQQMKNGLTEVVDVPVPAIRPGFILVRNAASLVSAGTERMVVDFAEKNLLGKARSRPDLVRQVITKAQREGIIPTIEAAFNRLDQPMVLGYSSAGTVVEVGEGVRDFRPGDRVACAGGGYAVHAEYVLVPQNLVAQVPDNLNFEHASFATLGAIALHGFRLAAPQLGDRVAVIGLGLLGLLAAGIARAAGCEVFGVDLAESRVDLANKLGYSAVVRGLAEQAGVDFTHGLGFDSVLICADAKSNDPVELAGAIARDRAKVVAVGAVGLDIPRKVYYEKELDFLVSRSYGPGRYDPLYEEKGQDYPAGYIRWTEGRNLQAVVDLMASGRLDVEPLISHRFPIENAPEAYHLITGKTLQPFLAVLLTYPAQADAVIARRVEIQPSVAKKQEGEIVVGVLGAGNYANATFLPVIRKTGGTVLDTITSAAGVHARSAAKKFGFVAASSDEEDILNSEVINAVVILTRHHLHARQSIQALTHGKHVYCEKPVAVDLEQLDQLHAYLERGDMPLYMAGFNRRFAPLAVEMKRFFGELREPLHMQYRVNAGVLPLNHWLHDPVEGGGRLIGEGCHFIDWMTWLNGSLPESAVITALPDSGTYHEDNLTVTVQFKNGSLGSLHYLANGNRSAPKEYVEVSSAGSMAVLNDYRTLTLYRDGTKRNLNSGIQQDKGHHGAWKAFLDGIRTGSQVIPYLELLSVAELTIHLSAALRTGGSGQSVRLG